MPGDSNGLRGDASAIIPGPDLHVPLELVILISESDGDLMEGGVGGGMHRQ